MKIAPLSCPPDGLINLMPFLTHGGNDPLVTAIKALGRSIPLLATLRPKNSPGKGL